MVCFFHRTSSWSQALYSPSAQLLEAALALMQLTCSLFLPSSVDGSEAVQTEDASPVGAAKVGRLGGPSPNGFRLLGAGDCPGDGENEAT